jgi:hypothetical protein
MKVALRELAFARSGDKGADANVGVWAHTFESYELLRAQLTDAVVAEHFASLGPASVERYELPHLLAFNFLLRGVLGEGGAARGLRTDAQAKVYSARILQIEIDAPAPRSEGA